MSDIMALNVVGTDGIVPIYDPTARWCWWSINEIYTGAAGQGKYIPKIDDYVIDPSTYTVYVVEHLDLVTLIPRLKEKRPAGSTGTFSDLDVLVGIGPMTYADTYRVYLDTQTTPFTLSVDARLHVGGSTVKTCTIYRGNDLTITGDIISNIYDASGNMLGHAIPLEVAATRLYDNAAIKIVPACNTLTRMPDGEIVTAVFHDDFGHVVSKRQLMVENTTFIRPAYVEDKYITNIAIESSFMSMSHGDTIEFPLNVPLNALNIMGVVHYSDGSTIRLPIDGSKFKLYGLDQYVSSIVGQKLDLVLSYTLSEGEAAYVSTPTNGKFITKHYSLVTVEANNSYTVKLFGYPEFISMYEGYRMRWYLLNLDRNICTDVSAHVRYSEAHGAFEPLGYGFVQKRVATLMLSDVSGAYRSFIHTQQFDIILRGDVAVYDTPWEISLESVANRSLYGHQLRIDRNFNFKNKFTIHSGSNTLTDWLGRVYYRTYPLVNPLTETRVPEPTHFVVCYEDKSEKYVITDWHTELDLGVIIPVNKNVYIKFVKPTATGDMVLSIASMVVKS